MNFKVWLENQIVSFDFDSTMTKPWFNQDNETWDEGDPANADHHHNDNINLMKTYANQGYTIYIVTARKQRDIPEVHDFVKTLQLPVAKVIATDGKNKGPILQQLGVLIHHDDLEQKHEDPNAEFKGKWVKIYHPVDGF